MIAKEFLKTKQAFYGENGFSAYGEFGEDLVANTVGEYARQEAIGLLKFALSRGLEVSLGLLVDSEDVYNSPEEYYDLFKQSTNTESK